MTTTAGGQLERMGFAISKYWNQQPWWFDSLEKDQQLTILADYNINHQDPKAAKAKKRADMVERLQKRRRELKSQGAKYASE